MRPILFRPNYSEAPLGETWVGSFEHFGVF